MPAHPLAIYTSTRDPATVPGVAHLVYRGGLVYVQLPDGSKVQLSPIPESSMGLYGPGLVRNPEFLDGTTGDWVQEPPGDIYDVFDIETSDTGQSSIAARTPGNDNVLHFSPDCGAALLLPVNQAVHAGETWQAVVYSSEDHNSGSIYLGNYPVDYLGTNRLTNETGTPMPQVINWTVEVDAPSFSLVLTGSFFLSYVQVRQVLAAPIAMMGLDVGTPSNGLRFTEDRGLEVWGLASGDPGLQGRVYVDESGFLKVSAGGG